MVNLTSLLHLLAPLHHHTTTTTMMNTTTALTTYTLPSLPYAYTALEPYISAQIMELHHSKHHQAYITNLNNALQSHLAAVAAGDLESQVALQQAIKFNGGGHINHSLFWRNLAPAGSDEAKVEVASELGREIEQTWGGWEEFRREFGRVLLGIQGSGWGWLVREENGRGRLRIVTTKDQDPVVGGERVVLGVDMWEHAYYLQYLNGKAAYVENIWNVINWKTAEERFVGRVDDREKTEL
ncbi:hypothetical protein VTI74DRAFT_8964 [Chaetomium olivicolor]